MTKSRKAALALGLAGTLVGSGLVIGTADALRPDMDVSGCPTSGTLANVDIVYLGHYESGGEELPYSFKGGGNRTGLTRIVGEPDRKTFFVVSSYEPTVWDFSRVDPTRIAGVHASGFYEQGVTGVPSSSPITLRHKAANNGNDPTAVADGCLSIQYLYKASDAPVISSVIESALGKAPRSALMAYSSDTFDLSFKGMAPPSTSGGADPAPSSIVSENPINDKGLQPGDAGLRQMVQNGDLVPVRSEVVGQWMQSGMLRPEGSMANSNGRDMIMGGSNTYVVPRSIGRLPDGLFGAHLATFVLPPGVSAPTGMPTHSSFYRYVGPAFPWAGKSYADPNARIGLGARIQRRYTQQQPMTRVDWTGSGSMNVVTFPDSTYQSGPRGPDSWMRQQEQMRQMELQRTMQQAGQSSSYRMQDASVGAEDESDLPGWAKAFLLCMGLVGVILIGIWQRRRIAEGWSSMMDLVNDVRSEASARDQDEQAAVREVAPQERHGKDAVHAAPAYEATIQQRSPGPPAPTGNPAQTVMQLTSDVVDATESDAAVVEVSRLRKDLTAAMARSWDGDIASELESLVKHCSTAASEYLAVRTRTATAAATAMESSLLEGTRSIREKLRELADQQARRDAGSVATQEGFIRRRHGRDGLDPID
jgi:hypothetical protein